METIEQMLHPLLVDCYKVSFVFVPIQKPGFVEISQIILVKYEFPRNWALMKNPLSAYESVDFG